MLVYKAFCASRRKRQENLEKFAFLAHYFVVVKVFVVGSALLH